MSEIQIDYTSRDYAALKEDLISLVNLNTGKTWDPSDSSDLGNVLVEAFAYMGDIMSYYIDRVANETRVDTAVKTDTLLGFAELYGIKSSGPTPAECTIQFTNISDVVVDLPIGTQVMAPLNYGPFAQAYFQTTEGYTAIQPGQVISIPAVEGKTVNTDREDYIDPTYHKPLPATIGTSDGTANQEIDILDTGIVDSSLIVYIGQGVAFSPWTYVDTLIEYGPDSLVFTTRQNSDGTLTVVFGDGVNGAVPPASQLISALYNVSVGRYGNVTSGTVTELSFIPGQVDPEVLTYFDVTNPSAAVGGADSDSLTQLRKKIKAAIVSRRRAVTLSDYEYLAYQVQTLGRAKASAAVYSLVNLYIQTQNDGTSTPGIVSGVPTNNWTKLKTAVENYLADKIPVGVTLNIQPPTYMPVYLDVTVMISGTYKRSTMKLEVYKTLLSSTGLFSYNNNEFGRSIALSSVIATLAALDSVESVTVNQLNVTGAATAASIALSPNQIPYLLPANLQITVTGGIDL